MTPRLFRGWHVVAGSFLVLMLGFGAAYSCPAFAEAIADEFGASLGGMAMVPAVSTGLAFLASAVGGPLADRFGSRRVAMAGMALVGLGLASASAAASFERVLFCYGGLVGLGLGFAYVPAIAAVQRWFGRRRGFASGLALSGVGLGTALVPAVAELPARLGGDWRDALLVCGALVALGGVGGAAMLGEPPPDRRPAAPEGEAAAPVPAAGGMALREVFRSRDFALLYGGALLLSAPIALPFAHLVASAQDSGMARGEALALVGAVGLGSIPGRVAAGLLADRLGRRAVFLVCCGGVAAATLLWAAAAADARAFAPFAVAFGVFQSGFVALLPTFATDLFGRRAAAGTIGVLYTGRGVGVLAATPAFALGTAVLAMAGKPARRLRGRRGARAVADRHHRRDGRPAVDEAVAPGSRARPLAAFRRRPYIVANDITIRSSEGGPPGGRLFCFGPLGPWTNAMPGIERPQHEGLEARIADAIAPTVEHMGYELVRVQVSGKERPVVQIMADRADGTTFTVEDCAAISHAVGAVLDVEDPIRGEWALEVSSAGIDRPLTRAKDWERYAGHVAQVELVVPLEGRKRFKGVAMGADAEVARLRLEDGAELAFPRGNIRRAKLVLTDELIAATAAPRKEN